MSHLKHRLYLHQLDEEIGRQQDKNTLNSIKSSTSPPETNGSTVVRPKHSNADEAEQNDLKITVLRLLRPLKRKQKNSLKYRKKQTQKEEEINKFPKENQENTIKQVKKTIQDFKTEIEVINEKQAKGILKTKIWVKNHKCR